MEQMHVEPIRFKDVRGNELLYIKIKKGEKEVLINVGNRTFKSVEELINPPQPELPLKQTQEQLREKAHNIATKIATDTINK